MSTALLREGSDRQGSGPHNARAVFEFRRQDLQRTRGCCQRLLSNSLIDLSHQVRPTVNDAASQDKTARVKCVDQADRTGDEGLCRPIDHTKRQGVSCIRAAGNRFSGDRIQLPSSRIQKVGPCGRVARNGFPSLPGNRPSSCEGLQATPIAAGAGGTFRVDDDMAQFARCVGAT